MVLQGVESFWLSIFPISYGIIDKLYTICRGLCGVLRTLLSLDIVCLRDLHVWNNVLLARVLWDIHLKNDSLWVKWIHDTCLSRVELWHWEPKRGDSPLIKKILVIRSYMIHRYGSVVAAIALLSKLSALSSSGLAYAFFCNVATSSSVIWPSVVWGPDVLPKHAYIVALCQMEASH